MNVGEILRQLTAAATWRRRSAIAPSRATPKHRLVHQGHLPEHPAGPRPLDDFAVQGNGYAALQDDVHQCARLTLRQDGLAAGVAHPRRVSQAIGQGLLAERVLELLLVQRYQLAGDLRLRRRAARGTSCGLLKSRSPIRRGHDSARIPA